MNDEEVDYVVIGGFAATLHGSPLPTADVDVLPDRSGDNLERLAAALRRLHARLRTATGAVDIPALDKEFLAAMPLMLNLSTDHGDVDVTFEPAGPRQGFAEWARDAANVVIGDGLTIRVASLNAIIDSKRAAGRPKDLGAIPYLESLRDELAPDDDR